MTDPKNDTAPEAPTAPDAVELTDTELNISGGRDAASGLATGVRANKPTIGDVKNLTGIDD